MIRVTDEERKSILESHRQLFQKQVMIEKTDNLTPLEVKDLAQDKGGVTVKGDGSVSEYTNHINEKDDKWIQDVDMDEGSFTEYCGGEVTCECVEKAQKEGGKPAKQAQLYLNMNSDKCKSLQ